MGMMSEGRTVVDALAATIGGHGRGMKSLLTFASQGACIISRAEPSRAEPSRAEPSRAEPSRAEPSRAEPSAMSASGAWRRLHLPTSPPESSRRPGVGRSAHQPSGPSGPPSSSARRRARGVRGLVAALLSVPLQAAVTGTALSLFATLRVLVDVAQSIYNLPADMRAFQVFQRGLKQQITEYYKFKGIPYVHTRDGGIRPGRPIC